MSSGLRAPRRLLAQCICAPVSLAAAVLLTGSLNTISRKFQNDATGVGSDGSSRRFDHPWVQVGRRAFFFFFFLAIFLCREMRL